MMKSLNGWKFNEMEGKSAATKKRISYSEKVRNNHHWLFFLKQVWYISDMANKTPFSNTKAALGCSIFAILGVAVLGFVLSFFTENKELAASVRSRCFLGLVIGIVMIAVWKIVSVHLE
jgi:hypothetical protein